jgi:hypothetical protein
MPASSSITLIAAIWRQNGVYLPVIACMRTPSGRYGFIAVKTPVTPSQLPINAAETAQLDLMKAAAEFDPPKSELDARLLMRKIGYAMARTVELADVAPADLILQREAELDETIRECRPEVDAELKEDDSIVKDTYERLTRAGFSSEDAANMITRAFVIEYFRQARDELDITLLEQTLSRLPKFPDDTPYSYESLQDAPAEPSTEAPESDQEPEIDEESLAELGVAYAMQILRRQQEGVSDKAILTLNAFEQVVLTALGQLVSWRLRYLESITAVVNRLSGQDVSPGSVLETLSRLEARYALYSWTPDPAKFPEHAGRQFFIPTPIGERSLKAARKLS